ncbi:MAG: zinc ribbon domain-containing protein [Verrucomicrobiota bacterium]
MSDTPPPLPPDTPGGEVRARSKFTCPACGAEATWNPARQALVCAYCGTSSPAELQTGADGQPVIREHDLAAALRSIPDSKRGWKAATTQVRCQHCHAISVFEGARIGQRCDFCGASSLVPYSEVHEAFSPESLLPKRIAESEVRERMRQWYQTRWFAPNALGRRALTDTVQGIYLPYWTFDAQVHADWTAESGYYYYDTEHYTDAQGKPQTRQVRKIRWESSAGSLDHFFDDELVPASRGVDLPLLRGVEPFPTRDLVPYDPGFLAGWTVERYQIDLVAAAQHARDTMTARLRDLCARQVPGDTHRHLQVAADWSGQTFKHILVPVWLLTYDYGRKSYQVVINGSTGAIAGRHPYSVWKILLAVVVLLLFAAFWMGVADRRH